MTLNVKKAILLVIFLIYLPLSFLVLKSNQENGDSKTLRFFKESKYEMALAYAEELEKQSPSSKYPLYQAYILREIGNLEQSTAFLKKALKPSKTDQNFETLIEINLNLSLNAYLKKDLIAFENSLLTLKQLKNSNKKNNETNYLDLFLALDAFLKEDYEKASSLFQKHKSYKATSVWMEHSFEKTFTPQWIDAKITRCFLENSQFDKACKLNTTPDKSYFLKGLQALKDNTNASFYFDQINDKKAIREEFAPIILKLRPHLLECAACNSWGNFAAWLTFFNEFTDSDSLALSLAEEIKSHFKAKNDHLSLDLFEKIEGELHVKLLYIINQKMDKSLYNKDFNKTLQYAKLFKTFENKAFIEKTAKLTLELLNLPQDDMQEGIKSLNLWINLEKTPEKKSLMAKKLAALSLHHFQNNQLYDKAEKLFEIALEVAPEKDKAAITHILKTNLLLLHKKALSEDRVEQHPHILNIAKFLNLNVLKLYDEQEKNELLADANYFLSKGFYEKAKTRTLFVLMLEPENEKANALMKILQEEEQLHN